MTYCELSGSHRESIGESSGPTASRTFLTTWGNRWSLVEGLLGDSDEYPKKWPALGHCRISNVEIMPLSAALRTSGVITDPETTLPNYESGGKPAAVIRVSYAPAFDEKEWPSDIEKPEHRDGTTLRLQTRGSGQFLKIPGRAMKWTSDSPGEQEELDNNPPPPDLPSFVVIPLSEFRVQWDFVDDPPIDALEALIGGVNDDTFLGSPAGTLLFESYEIDDSFRCAIDNPHTNRVTAVFKKRAIKVGAETYGWNHLYNENPPGWTKTKLNNDEPAYPENDMSEMFT